MDSNYLKLLFIRLKILKKRKKCVLFVFIILILVAIWILRYIFHDWYVIVVCSIVIAVIIEFLMILFYFIVNDKIRHKWFLEQYYNKYFIGSIDEFKPAKKIQKIVNLNTNVLVKSQYIKAAENFMYCISVTEKNIAVITSVESGDGKTTTASNLSMALALIGKKVLLVDSDMRKPSLHKIFSRDNTNGLSDVYSRKKEADECINKNVYNNLDVLFAGTPPPNPSELIIQDFTKKLYEKFSGEYDYIIIDSPPLKISDDSLKYKNIAGGVIIVIKHGKTLYRHLLKHIKKISSRNIHLLGFILNNGHL